MAQFPAVVYRGIEMEIVNTREHVRRHIFTPDGVTYLYTQWTFDFDCRFNPAATSYVATVSTGNFEDLQVQQQPGVMPWGTDNLLRKFLAQPRGKLTIRPAHGGVTLNSPKLGFVVDANNGPIVEECSIRRVLGQRQFEIRFRVTTWINECPEPSEFPGFEGSSGVGEQLDPDDLKRSNPLLSHRWTRRVAIDQDHFTALITEGEAKFRTDWMNLYEIFPDCLRGDLFHPIEGNFQREQIEVEALSDGTGLRYSFIDREKPFNFGAQNPATRLEAYATAWWGQQGWADALLEEGAIALGMRAGFGNVAQLIGQIGGHAARMIIRQMPRYNLRIFVRAWGNRDSSRAVLTSLIEKIIEKKIGNIGGRTYEKSITQDINGKFCEGTITVSWGFLTAETIGAINAILGVVGVNPIGGQPPQWGNLLSAMDINEDIDVPLYNFKLTQDRFQGNLQPPNTRNTRGTWIGGVYAQLLASPCNPPSRPGLNEPREALLNITWRQ